jgi:hypothetical protein
MPILGYWMCLKKIYKFVVNFHNYAASIYNETKLLVNRYSPSTGSQHFAEKLHIQFL